ncbi:MAG TPA: hypothetical protein VGH28_32860 [Polyangiaceae bacterium]|jgi:hypothetical protein
MRSRFILGFCALSALAFVRCVGGDDSAATDGGNDSGNDVTVTDGAPEAAVDATADASADVEADAPRPVPKAVGDFDWAASPDGVGGGPIAYDAQGNLFFAWQMYYDITFNGTTYTDAGTWDAILAKFDPTGKVLWVKQVGGTSSDQILALATDPAGDVYATILTQSPTISFGNNITYNKVGTNGDGLLVKLKGSDGTAVWLADYTPTGDNWLACGQLAYGGGRLGMSCWSYQQGIALTKDSDGSPLALSCLDCSGSDPEHHNIYVASINPANGKAYWANVIAGDADTIPTSLAVDSKGAAVLAFASFADVVHDPTNTINWTYQGVKGAIALIAKLASTNGAGIWFKQFTDGTTNNNNQTSPGQVAIDSNDDVIFGGQIYGQVPFGTVTLKSAGNNDGFVTKLKGGFGDVIWALTFGGTGMDQGALVGVDAWDEVFVAQECGSTDGKLGTMSFPAVPASHSGICIGKLDPSGTALWATGIVSSSASPGPWPYAGLAVDPSVGDVTVQGGFQGTVDLGDGNPVTNKSAQEIEFVVTHNP